MNRPPHRKRDTAVKGHVAAGLCHSAAQIVHARGPDLKGIAMSDMEHQERTEPSEAQNAHEGSPKAKGKQDRDTGFLFCPRCGKVVLGAGVNSLCVQCGHRFCPCCSD